MLDVVNGFANGWIASHVISAFVQHDVFEAMAAQPMTLKELVSRYRGNAGHLHAGLRLLYGLGWVELVEPDQYGAVTGAGLAQQLPSDLVKLTQLPLAQALVTEQSELCERLLGWLERCGAGWAGVEPAVASVLDGVLCTPLLAQMYALGCDVLEGTQPSGISAVALQAMRTLFVQRGWGQVEAARFRLTPSGQALLASSGALGTVLSYTPMFHQMDDLLFGEVQAIFGKDEQGHELHVDRTANVIASGVQHQNHFAELDTLILRIFDQHPLEMQPRYIADMGCGDGSLLHRIYELVKTRSARGRALAEYPLTLIGADYNALSLEATGRTLTGLPHLLVRGDIADPQQLMADLAAAGIIDPENILHVRSFLDHDRSFLPVEDKTAAQRREGLNGAGVYVARDGSEINPAHAVQGLVEHLRRWRRAVSRFGLLLLEVHCLRPNTVKRLGSMTESAHYDAFHAFSGQQLVEASVFLMAATEAGFFPEPGMSQTIPKNLDFTRISLHRLLPQPYTVRHPVPTDLPRLKQLDRQCQPDALHTPAAEIERRVCGFAQGQMVLEVDGQIVAALYTQRIDSVEALRNTCYAELAQLHRPEGRYVQLLGLFVVPEMQGRGFSDVLIDLMLVYAATLDGVDAVVGITRCANFVQHKAGCRFDHYIQLRDELGQLKDPMLHFHASHGAALLAVLPGFRPEDTDNEGAGILLEYTLRSGASAATKTNATQAVAERFTLAAEQIEPAVRSTVMQVLGSQRAAAYGPQIPLMEMGLNSLELLELRLLLSARMGESLTATFLFSYGTPAAIIEYFMVKAKVRLMPQTTTAPTPAHATHASPNYGLWQGSTDSDEAIAIIGVACRLPGGANTPAQFWQGLLEARDAVGALPANRQLLWGSRTAPCRWQAGFLDEVECFDAGFFRISPREAKLLDPQQRLLLEMAWEALESAAIAPATLRGTRSGVFVGMMGSDYGDVIARQGSEADFNAHFATGNACSVAAGRLSYFFDWQGPALSIDTACSSSLVAVHTACHSLLRGECNLALAAGVNLLLDDTRFLAYEQAGMLSSHGRCRTFDASADGYARGEGCAAVILKRLSNAQADGDPIMAVIRGSAINQDGSSSGLTAPNQLAQQAVIEAALAQAGVAPHEIGYLEAHGTGTKLGDPIEVMAAAQALGAGRPDDQPLLMGSLKSSIGHLEAAAGIAGLIKTVLSMQQGILPAQLHFVTPNPHIPWEGLPVRVVAQAQAWPAGLKRAGISSFGFSGTNAHAIVEEYVGPQRAPTILSGPVIVVLSAKNQEQLQDQVQQLLAYLECQAEVNLADLAYTLQVGREALEVRLALVARSMHELKERLSGYAPSEASQEDIYQGEFKHGQETVALFRDDEERQRTIEMWVAKGELGKLAQRWVQGLEVAWGQLYGETKPKRISLPTYPFAKERYWVPQTAVQGRPEHSLHPLVHRNTSDLSEQRFSTMLTGEEFFLRDHVVQGKRVVPAAAQLEWARAAVALASGGEVGTAGRSVLLQEVTWLCPLVVAQPQEVQIGLEMQEDGRIGFEIYSGSGDEAVVYSQGWAQLVEVGETPWVDLEAVRRQCEQTLTSQACYARFAQLGLAYGSSFQVLHELRLGNNVAVGTLRLTGEVPAAYVWLPNMLDGALQASLGLTQDKINAALALPFAVAQVRQWDPLPTPAWVVVRSGAGDSATIRKLDVDIVDASGRVALRLSGFSTRPLHEAVDSAVIAPQRVATPLALPEPVLVGELTLAPVWETVAETGEAWPLSQQQIALVGNPEGGQPAWLTYYPQALRIALTGAESIETLVERLRSDAPLDHLVWWVPPAYALGAQLGFKLIKALLALGYGSRSLGLTVVTQQAQAVSPSEAVDATAAGVHGLIGSLAKEYEHWRLRLLDVPAYEDIPLAWLLKQPADGRGDARVYRHGQGYQQRLVPCTLPAAKGSAYRTGGVYVILGGAGGLGTALSEYLIQHYQAQVVWLGRRAEDASIAQQCARLGALGPTPLYLQADATDRKALEVAHEVIRHRFGAIHGVVHAAIVLADRSLVQMDEATFEAAWSAKVATTENLSQVFGQERLDWLMFFSSVQSFMKAPGQSNYAAGCCFADAFAQNLRGQPYPVKVMHWGYWGSVGVVASAPYQERMAKLGIGSIEAPAAMAVLERLLAGPVDQLAFIKTTQVAAAGTLGVAAHETVAAVLAAPAVVLPPTAEVAQPVVAPIQAKIAQVQPPSYFDLQTSRANEKQLASHVRQCIRESVAQVLQLSEEQLREERAFMAYGVDSITGVQLVHEINTQLGLKLPTTVLFDYVTIEQLSVHILSVHREHLSSASLSTMQDQAVATLQPANGPDLIGRTHRRRRIQSTALAGPKATERSGLFYHRVWLERPGSIADLRIVEDELAPLDEHEVRIAVRAFSLNFGDLLCVKGMYPTQPPYPFTPGFEASGVVAAVGRGVTRVAVGEAVIALAGEALGAHATAFTCAESRVFKCPPKQSFETACALPAVAVTMIECFKKAQLKRGESILIQTAAGGTGLIAVQLAQHAGAEIYATAGSQSKLDYLASLGVPHRINYLQEDFEVEIARLTNGRGVDVVINTLAGDALQKGLNCLAPGGRYIEIAMTSLKSARTIDLSGLNDNQTFHSVDLRKLGRSQPAVMQTAIHELAHLLEQDVIRPTLSQVFTFDKIQDAYRCLENRQNIGKVVVSIPEAYRFRARATLANTAEQEPIAVIGMSGRFACADNLQALWMALAEGQDLIEEVTRWDLSRHYPVASETYCRHGGFLRDIDCFDPLFFNISGLEATYMDPQQRLFLEEAWRALEDAGYAGAEIAGQRCGVYVGCTSGDYQNLLDTTAPAQAFWGNAGSVIPARIAYHLNLHGPAVAIDTACSSSLVALHQACQGLRAGETKLALAGGVFVQSTESFYLKANRAGMLSPTGHCYTFDARADGFVPGEGVGVVVLKRLSQAQADRDSIYGVILGSGINQDGATNGLTAPSALSQERLEREVYQRFEIDPGTIGLVEAHGTGTVLGDPIEFRALMQAFNQGGARQHACALGSIKSNLGHAATAAGIAGVLKVLLALRHRQIPPSLHFAQGNPHIDFEHSPFYVNTELKEWESIAGTERRAAVSSFGFSGTNAHVVIGEPSASAEPMPARPSYLIVLSARTAEQLRHQAEQLVAHCQNEMVEMGAMSYTLWMGRRHFGHRLGCVARDHAQLIERLEQWLTQGAAMGVVVDHVKTVQREQVALMRLGKQCLVEYGRANVLEDAEEPLAVIADLYCQGYDLPWEQLFDQVKPKRISLPTYPFAKERYWVPQQMVQGGLERQLHPLIHRNTSDLSEQRFSTTLTGEEFFLRDHVVQGKRVVPGVAQLEWARAAVTLASGGEVGMAGRLVLLQEVTWLRPLVVVQPQEVHISLEAQQDGRIGFEIYSGSGDEAVLYSQGWAQLAEVGEAPQVDLKALWEHCEQTLTGEACYARFAQLGLSYGPSFQIMNELRVGHNLVVGALHARSEVPVGYGWAPNVLDGALQTSMWLTQDKSAAPLALPFAVAQVRQWDEIPTTAWAIVRPGAGDSMAVRKLEIEIVDASGRVALRLSGFSTRPFHNAAAGEAVSIASAVRGPQTLEQGLPVVTAQDPIDFEQRAVQQVSHAHLASRVGQGVRQSIVQILKLDEDQLTEDRAFAEYGVDSITAVALVNAINTQLGLNLPTTVLFDYVTVEQLSAYIIAAHWERLSVDLAATTETRSSSALLSPLNQALPQTLDQELPVVTAQDPIDFEQRAVQQVNHAHLASRVRQGVRQSIVQILKLDEDQLTEDRAFAEYGVDSITAVALVNAINTQLGLNLPTTVLFDYVTVEQLSAYIISAYRQHLSVDLAATTATQPTATPLLPPNPMGRRRRQRFQAPAPSLPTDAGRTSPTYHRLLLTRPGSIDDLHMVEEVVAPLGEHDVRIEVRAFSLNFGDLLCVKGLYPTQPPYPFTPGFEASGVVAAVGRSVTRVAVGEAVIALASESLGAHASALTCSQSQVFACPAGLSFEAACALPAVAVTMIECFKKAQLKAGQRILIQTAAGGTGLIAVQLAQSAGAEIYATAGSQAKLDYLTSLGVPHRINYLEEDFEMAIARLTNGRGVDVVINTLAGDALQKGLNCLAPGGHYIEIAMTSLKSARTIDLSGLNDNQTFHSVDLRKLGRSQPEVIQAAMHELARLLEQGVIRPTLSQVFTFEKTQDAYRWLENRQNIGKVVVSIPEAYRFCARATLASTAEQAPKPHYSTTPQDEMEMAVLAAPAVELPQMLDQGLPVVTVQDQIDFDTQLALLLRAQLQAMGWLAQDAHLPAPYARWREHSLHLLQARGLLTQAAANPAELWVQWEAYCNSMQNDPVLRARVRLVDTTLRALPMVLRGDQKATEVLFPQGQVYLVEEVYRGHPVADYFNAVLVERLVAYVRARLQADAQTKLRIIEIGAGTGGTSARVFAQLAAYALQIEEYAYTDLSPAFLLHAQKNYAVPYLQTKRLDIERTPSEQGFEVGHYDIVIAANVLHATRDIRCTVRHAKALLKGNGLLLLNELTDMGLFAHLTFGLLEGWWLAQDHELRITGTPGLMPQTWQQVLAAEGFGNIQFPAEVAHGLGQQIVVAFSDGMLRQQGNVVLPLPQAGSMAVRTPQIPTVPPVNCDAQLL